MAAPKKMGLSLYADLLDTNKEKAASSTISSAPFKYNVAKDDEEGEAAAAAKKKDASLQFQPVRRPQTQPKISRPAQKKAPSSHTLSSSTTTASLGPTSTSSPDKQTPPVTSTPTQQPNLPRSNFEDWVGGDDDDEYYVDNRPKRERGGKNKKKKKGGVQQETRTWSWDDIYDPTLPNNYADYKGSDEQVMEIRDWKARLYYHRLKEAKKESTARSEEVESRPAANSRLMPIDSVIIADSSLPDMFAPPTKLSFAPPSFDNAPIRPAVEDDDDDYYPLAIPSQPSGKSDSYEPLASMSLPNDPTGEDAYARRMQMGGGVQAPSNPPPQAAPAIITPEVQLSPANDKAAIDIAAKKAEAAAKIAAFKAKVEAHKAAKAAATSAAIVPPGPAVTADTAAPPPPPPGEPEEPGNTISRAPVRYQLPSPDLVNADDATMVDDAEAEDAPRSLRPGQKGFAERLLKKYGWEKGQGLGAEGNEGITTALVAKAEKRKKLADVQGGGWAAPANMGKLVGGKRRKVAVGDGGDGAAEVNEGEPYGPLSAVIKLSNMLTGLDIDEEIQDKDLYGEIGREMEGQYGKVERVFIWRRESGGEDDVFVKFVSQLSALRAVGACDGTEFAGNIMGANFWEEGAFEAGRYA
ncbi:hypothetical protein LTR78_009622 [Recurvomyces mirabilis]|uniref:G-patch domain-containing protein n=1 Tax=Recurvomyces mirabilis TaxID=574656 RepID=A0AAE0TS35_9PEZI|nr:hypothetical protein LTR78_009622 [Recurvomyces mirabilis]KAK5156621.1 hypothetical protein LTS14_004833 [Recurvomyces mirabilis]